MTGIDFLTSLSDITLCCRHKKNWSKPNKWLFQPLLHWVVFHLQSRRLFCNSLLATSSLLNARAHMHSWWQHFNSIEKTDMPAVVKSHQFQCLGMQPFQLEVNIPHIPSDHWFHLLILKWCDSLISIIGLFYVSLIWFQTSSSQVPVILDWSSYNFTYLTSYCYHTEIRTEILYNLRWCQKIRRPL